MEDSSAIPARDRARVELREIESLVRLLIQYFDLSASGRMPSEDVLQPDRIAQELIERQKVLRSIAGELVQHQNMNKLIEKVRASLQREEQKLVQLGGTLREAELRLQGPDMDHEARIAALEGAKKVNVKDIVELAAKIGSSYSAPPNWTPTEPLGNRLPPAPTEEMMRSGHLGKEKPATM
uniref:Mediator of RNA polymerase II transcription subunit 4 n=1 Tax=Rhodosorus marinus TaxID=101924 RepID=A0A7S3EEQ3_9RHOD|mmetsp:Transcript_30849/g.118257  ORF Transcript_30849/g.118257 Transcript_30849/m.118257 type:complete len:181 (+) Transcript_30849:1589-2131(+)